MDNMPTPDRRKELEANNWVCDYQTHRMLWEAQCITSLIQDAMDESTNLEVTQVALQGVERLLAAAIQRTGWTAIGWPSAETAPQA